VSGKADISVFEAPIFDGALGQLASVLVDCVFRNLLPTAPNPE